MVDSAKPPGSHDSHKHHSVPQKPHDYHKHHSEKPKLAKSVIKYWRRGFHGATLDEIQKLNEGALKLVGDAIKQVLQWAVTQQKKRDQEAKQNQ